MQTYGYWISPHGALISVLHWGDHGPVARDYLSKYDKLSVNSTIATMEMYKRGFLRVAIDNRQGLYVDNPEIYSFDKFTLAQQRAVRKIVSDRDVRIHVNGNFHAKDSIFSEEEIRAICNVRGKVLL